MCGGGKPSAAVKELAEKRVESALPKTEFEVGDRVRVTRDDSISANVKAGDVGTVVRGASTGVFVRMDEWRGWRQLSQPRGKRGWDWLVDREHLEKVPHDFRVGERVRLADHPEREGRVVAVRKGKYDVTRDSEWVEVDWDDGTNGGYRPRAVERVPVPENPEAHHGFEVGDVVCLVDKRGERYSADLGATARVVGGPRKGFGGKEYLDVQWLSGQNTQRDGAYYPSMFEKVTVEPKSDVIYWRERAEKAEARLAKIRDTSLAYDAALEGIGA